MFTQGQEINLGLSKSGLDSPFYVKNGGGSLKRFPYDVLIIDDGAILFSITILHSSISGAVSKNRRISSRKDRKSYERGAVADKEKRV